MPPPPLQVPCQRVSQPNFFFFFFFYPFPFGERGLLSIADDRAEFPLWPASRNESAPSTGLGPTLMTQKTKELSVPDQR